MEVKNLGIQQDKTIVKMQLPKEKTHQLNVQDHFETIPAPENPAPYKKWTVLSYVAADINIQDSMVETVDKMELTGSDENTHMVVQLDKGPTPLPELEPDWKHCRRYYVTHDEELNKLNSQVLAQYGPTNMSDPKTLKDFLVWGLKTFPSEYVVLLLNSHGNSFLGALHDNSESPGVFMSLPQMEGAISEAEKETGKHINLIAFNACLMGNLEAAYQLKDCADYMTASEEIEYTPGWTLDDQYKLDKATSEQAKQISTVLGSAFKSLQDAMQTKLNMTPKELAELIVSTNAKHPQATPTFSALDLKEMPNLANSIKELGHAIKKTEHKEEIQNSIYYSEYYGIGWTPYNELHDVQQTCKNLLKNSSDEDVKSAAEKVIAAGKKAVIANAVDKNKHPQSTGLNFFAPIQKDIGCEDKYEKLAFEKDTEWQKSLDHIKKESIPEQGQFWMGF